MGREHLSSSGGAVPDGMAGRGEGRGRCMSPTVAYRPARRRFPDSAAVPVAEPAPAPAPRRQRRHASRGRPLRIGRVKYAWSLIAGALSFTGFYFLLFPGRGMPHVDRLLGHLLAWPLGFLALSGLFSLVVFFGFKLGSEPVTQQTALRHYVGRKLAKLGLVVALFNAGWLLVLFLAALLSLTGAA